MIFNVREIKDPIIWDAFILTNNSWCFFQSFTWGELQQALGYQVNRIGFYSDKDLIAVAQVTIIKAKRGTFLHIRHGPVVKNTILANTNIWEQIKRHIIKLAKYHSAWFIRISPMIDDSNENHRLFRELGFRSAPIHAMDAELCWVLDLTPQESELLGKMRKTTRYLIRQAEKLKVDVRETEDISQFLQLYRKTVKRQHFVTHKGIAEEFQIFSKLGQAKLFLAFYNNQCLAGALIIFSGNQAIYHHGASLPGKIPASYIIQWHVIKHAKKSGYLLYNLWGISPANSPRHPWLGTTLFKQGFGGEERKFLHAHDLPLNPMYWLTYTIEQYRRVYRGY